MYKRKRLGPLRTVAIRNSEVGRYSGGVNVQYEWQKKSVPEVVSAIWSESAIGEVRYRRFHCTSKSPSSGRDPWGKDRRNCNAERGRTKWRPILRHGDAADSGSSLDGHRQLS